LGVVQGITELLPISSTAHMRVVPALLGWQDPGSAFSAAMQLAALAAVVSYFWNDLRDLTVNSGRAVLRRKLDDRYFRLSVWIILATVPIGLAGLALAGVLNTCGSPLRTLSVIGYACLVMALLLAFAEVYARHKRTMAQASMVDALLVGIAQVGALIPGVSRSGSTLTAALALGFQRDEAARFSFLLGLPAIALAGLKELWELHKVHLGAHGWSVLALGLVVASISAFFAIWSLMRILERFTAWPFVIYRALLGAVLLAGVATGWLI
jgi:undecaprenyl-diphosphatase